MRRLFVTFSVVLMTTHTLAADWRNEWERLHIRRPEWSPEHTCATLAVVDERLRLAPIDPERRVYTGVYILNRRLMMAFAGAPQCVPEHGSATQTLLSREVAGSLSTDDELPVTLMFGECSGVQCPSPGLSKHRLHLSSDNIATDSLLSAEKSSAPFIPIDLRTRQLATAHSEAEPVYASVRHIDCQAIYLRFASDIKRATKASQWISSCETSRTTFGTPDVRRTISEQYFTSAESDFNADTLLRISGVDTKGVQRATEFVVLIREAGEWRLAFIGWM